MTFMNKETRYTKTKEGIKMSTMNCYAKVCDFYLYEFMFGWKSD